MKKSLKLLIFLSILGSAFSIFAEHHEIFDVVENADYERIKLLVEEDPESVNFVDERGVNPLFKLCERLGDEEDLDKREILEKIFKFLILYVVVDVNVVETRLPGFSVLQVAVYKNIPHHLVKLLVNNGADVSYVNSFGDSILDTAIIKYNAIEMPYFKELGKTYNYLMKVDAKFTEKFLDEFQEKIDLQSEVIENLKNTITFLKSRGATSMELIQ
ncbi:TPA: hypothetical protein DEO28_03190 [Candidatus Dependentiae bacterium]|nr:MAG: hypothetical protein UR14_C0005G0013 [candidate division TM6 bacterium GW2011_GWE2_31_21]KKP53089.1 MAG: hypothetical protein UR43_C0007G0013 [candidate division TM6 bacterium GW2011_GWF2_33_332]HBS47907.1 hypothetical protein [Candidatus Dependentiae bacterium]HBZ73489.1 hypothetical protein [Candidatus Dependentiae bacterium]